MYRYSFLIQVFDEFAYMLSFNGVLPICQSIKIIGQLIPTKFKVSRLDVNIS